MKKKIPWIVVTLFALWIVAGLRPPADESGFHARTFGRIPVLLNGRIQPIDSMARNTLLIIRGSQTLPRQMEGAGGEGSSGSRDRMSASEWLLEVAMKPEDADHRYLFRIHHPEVIRDLGLEGKGIKKSGLHWYSFHELESSPKALPLLEKEARRLQSVDSQLHNPAERQMVKLHRALMLYHRLKNSFRPESSRDFAAELTEFQKLIPAGVEAMEARSAGQEYDTETLQTFMSYVRDYDRVNFLSYPLIIPPAPENPHRNEWSNIGTNLLQAIRTRTFPETVNRYAELASAYRTGNQERFNQTVHALQERLQSEFPEATRKGDLESFFNYYRPFYKSQIVYILALLLACISWLNRSELLRKSAYLLMILAFIVHTSGIAFRMYLEGRPPVTNLYSSAVFVGWGAVLLGIILEKIYRDGIGSVVGSLIGFVTLLVAWSLSLDGDTMQMLQAVLDTNAWLATHVVTITIGYSATFVAGFLAMIYVLRGALTPSLKRETAQSLGRMVYGIVCFATLFSFVGTVLGGIWADQSWGRFWGWDPKENGALLIVLWNAAILHARWGGWIRERGLMLMALFGNIVTAFSWFGVNLLGVGLHSYGFMEGSFRWLMLFSISQIALILVGAIPQRFWWSFRKPATT